MKYQNSLAAYDYLKTTTKQKYIPVGCVPSGGVSAPGGCLPAKAVSARGGVSAQVGMCLRRGVSVCAGGLSACQIPPMNRMTDMCKNITLPQLHCGR